MLTGLTQFLIFYTICSSKVRTAHPTSLQVESVGSSSKVRTAHPTSRVCVSKTIDKDAASGSLG